MANGYDSSSSSSSSSKTTTNEGKIAPEGFHYMPDGTLMSNAEHERLYGNTGNDNPSVPLSQPCCGGIDFLNANSTTTGPVYLAEYGASQTYTSTSTVGTVGNTIMPTLNMTFLTNQWSHYQNSGCDWWANRIAHWNSQLPTVLAHPNQFWGDLKTAKITFAQAMHVACCCPGSPPALAPATPIAKTIDSFDLDFTDLPTKGGKKDFTIKGSYGASFFLEVSNEDIPRKCYNFTTKTFTTKYARLDGIIEDKEYRGSISFPAVTDSDQYDIYLYVKEGTSHVERSIRLFRDGSVDLNRSTGSSSTLLKKVLHQVLDVTITLQPHSITLGTGISPTNYTVAVERYRGKESKSFTALATVSSNALTIDRQPLDTDIGTIFSTTVGAAPIQIPGENIYPNVSDTDTVNGDVTSGTTVTMDTAVASKIKVGDKVTGNAALNATTATVVSLDSTYAFTLSQEIAIADGITLSFSNQMNYRWPVANTNVLKEGMVLIAGGNVPTGVSIAKYEEKVTLFEDTEKEEELTLKKVEAVDKSKDIPTVVKGIETVAPGTVVFSQQMPLAFAGDALKIVGYGKDNINTLTGWNISFSNLKASLNEITTLTNGVVSDATITVDSVLGIASETTQTVDGAITSSSKVVLDNIDGLFVDQVLYAVSAGSLSGNPTITSVNEATKTITLSSKQTFADGITLTFANSVISGVGIGSDVINPYVTNISSLDLTASTAQALEDNQTLTFKGAGNIVTITGNVLVDKVGPEDLVAYFDVDKFLTYHS